MTTPSTIGLDDLAVGQVYRCGSHVLTTAEIKRFAAEFDPQPFHLDEEAAAASFFQGLAASGWHTAALTMRLLLQGFPLARGVIGGGGDLRWLKPVRPNDELSVMAEVVSITPSRSDPDRAAVVLRVETRNGSGDLVQSFSPKLAVTR
jgi:acyl dehydratase